MLSGPARSDGDKRWPWPTITEGSGRRGFRPTSEAGGSTTGGLEASGKLRRPAELEPDGDYRHGRRETAEVIRADPLYPAELGNAIVKWHWIHLSPGQPCAKLFDLNRNMYFYQNLGFRLNKK